jgi:hypothetical protein
MGEQCMNRYIDLNRIEFVITDACSGRCKHCSNGEHPRGGGSIPQIPLLGNDDIPIAHEFEFELRL